MKLIKVSNKNQSGFFTTQFSEIINFEPNSQICVVNAVFSIGLENITIDNTCNKLSYTRKNLEVPISDVTLTNGKYSSNSLLQEMRTKINTAQTLYNEGVGNILGFDINPTINTEGRFVMSFSKSEMIDVINTNSSFVKMTYAANEFTSDNGPDAAVFNYNRFVIPNLKFNNGCGQCSAEFSNNFCFALITDPVTSVVVVSDMTFGLVADVTSYFKVIDGVRTSLAIAPTFGQVIKIVLDLGKVKFYADAVLLFEEVYDYNTTGYYLCAGLQKQANTVNNFEYTPQSFVDTTSVSGQTLYNDSNLNEVLKDDSSALVPRKFTMNFTTPDLAKLLGYNVDELSCSANSKSFIASNYFQDSFLDESIDIQLNLGKIVSYDGVSSKSAPIIAVIPIGSINSNFDRIVYDSNQFLFVDLNNRFSIPTTTLNFLILGSRNGKELIFEDGIALTLAVRTKENLL